MGFRKAECVLEVIAEIGKNTDLEIEELIHRFEKMKKRFKEHFKDRYIKIYIHPHNSGKKAIANILCSDFQEAVTDFSPWIKQELFPDIRLPERLMVAGTRYARTKK